MKTPKTHPARTGRMDDGNAFLADPGSGPAHVKDDLAEQLAEQFLVAATSAEETGQEDLDHVMAEERGGPFVVTPASKEFAAGVDASNIATAEVAAFPSAMRTGRQDLTSRR